MKDLNVIKTTLSIGLEKPVSFLHLTDTHIVRDTEKENGRAAVFGTTDEQIEDYFLKALDYAKKIICLLYTQVIWWIILHLPTLLF